MTNALTFLHPFFFHYQKFGSDVYPEVAPVSSVLYVRKQTNKQTIKKNQTPAANSYEGLACEIP